MNNNYLETKIVRLELEIERLEIKIEIQDQRIKEYEPIVTDYGNRNILFRFIGVITLLNLLLLLFR
jgi:hypothetical protein